MATVAAGTRLVLRAADRSVPLRVLREVPVVGEWTVPVLAPADPGLADLAGEVDVPTDRGVLTLRAHLRLDGDGLTLRPGGGAPLLVQRRSDVRADVRLAVQAVSEQEVRLRPVEADTVEPTLAGTTVSLSAGGLGLRVPPEQAVAGRSGRFYAELSLPGDRLVPVILDVVGADAALLRARFERIAPGDREALVRLVFEQQRRELAARRRLQEAWPAWG
jgi:hypothetical protein